MARGMGSLANRMGVAPPRTAVHAAKIWDFDTAADELLALIGKEEGLMARTRATQILMGLRQIVVKG
jgi:hypothetical protein